MIYNELEQRGTEDFPIEFYHLDKNHTRYHMAAHWHSETELIRVLDGVLNVRLDKTDYRAKRGDVFMVSPETIHSATPEDGCLYECIVLHMDFLCLPTYSCTFFIESILNHHYVAKEYHPYDNSEFNRAMNGVFDAMKIKSSGYKFRVISELYRLLGTIVDNHLYSLSETNLKMTNDKNIPKLKKVLTFIRSNYDKQITLNDMATITKMSPKYFCSFFKDMTGKSPFKYLCEYRIEKASQKLLRSDMTVTDIAYACGFNDLSYFIKTFKQIKKISPSAFRKK